MIKIDKYKLGTYTNPFVWIVGIGVVAGCFLTAVCKGTINNIKKVLGD